MRPKGPNWRGSINNNNNIIQIVLLREKSYFRKVRKCYAISEKREGRNVKMSKLCPLRESNSNIEKKLYAKTVPTNAQPLVPADVAETPLLWNLIRARLCHEKLASDFQSVQRGKTDGDAAPLFQKSPMWNSNPVRQDSQ